MKKIIMLASAIALCAGLSAVQAGPKCCPLSKAKAEAAEAKADCSATCFDAIEMTDAQKAKVAELTAACKAEKCSETSAKKMKEGLKEVLSEDQLAALKKACKGKGCDMGKKGCGMGKADGDSA